MSRVVTPVDSGEVRSRDGADSRSRPGLPRKGGALRNRLRTIFSLFAADAEIWNLLLACWWAAGAILLVVFAPFPGTIHTHDTPVPLEGAWRLLQGQKQGVDFASALGPAPYSLVAAGIALAGGGAAGLGYGTAMLFTLLVVGTWGGLCGRVPKATLTVAALLISCMAATPHLTPDGSVSDIGYSLLYNRMGYGVLALLVAVSLAPTTPDTVRRGAAVCGAAIAVLGFTKVNYFAAGLVVTAIAVTSAREWRCRQALVPFLAGFGGAALPHLYLSGFDLRSYYRDIALAGAAKAGTLDAERLTGLLAQNLLGFLVPTALGFLLAAAALHGAAPLARSRTWAPRVAALAVVCGLGVPIIATNTIVQWSGMPLTAIAFGAFAEHMARDFRRLGAAARAAALAGALVIGIPDAAAVWSACELRTRIESGAALRFEIPTESFKGLYFDADYHPYYIRTSYSDRVAEGLVLLRARAPQQARIFVADLSNPFPFALGWPSPLHSQVWWQRGVNFDETHYPPVEAALGDATALMLPRFPDHPDTTNALWALYGDYIREHFVRAGDSLAWILFLRADPAGAPHP